MRESRRRGYDKSDSKVLKQDSKTFNKLKDFNKKRNVSGSKKSADEDEGVSIEMDIDQGDIQSKFSVCSSPVKSEHSEEGSGTDFSALSSNTGGNGSESCGSKPNHFSPASTKKQGVSGIKFQPGIRLEAKDLGNGIWYAVKVVEVDWEEEEVLIHFEKWSQRYDEWIPMDSSRLRPALEPPGGFGKKISKIFKVGDKVMATWSDSRKYPATVITLLANDRYEVLFFDGFSKNIKGGRMTLLKEEELAKIQKLQPGIGPSNDVSNSLSLMADTASQLSRGPMETVLGSKEERRERKRKLNVAELFHLKKRPRLDSPSAQTAMDASKKARRGGCFGSRGRRKGQWAEDVPGRGVVSPQQVKTEPHSPEMFQEKQMDNVVGDAAFTVSNKGKEHATKARGKSKIEEFEKSAKKVRGDASYQRSEEDSKVVYARKLGRKFPKFKEAGRKHLSVSRKERGAEEDSHRRRRREAEGDAKPARQVDDWEPVGEPAYIVDGTDGPRKSIIVADPRIPPGWTRHTIQRMSGHSAGKWDVFFVCPEGRKFRTRHELRTYYEERGDPFQTEQFDFSLGRRKSKTTVDREGSSAVSSAASTGSLPNLSKITGRHPGPSSIHLTMGSAVNETSSDTPVRRVKTLLPRVRTPNIEGMSPSLPYGSLTSDFPHDSMAPSDGSVVLGGLKIQKDNDAFRCPKEGCNKNFRKENLLQMHIKHYHPEYNRFVASTPNVADLAYARTVGEPLEELHIRHPRSSFVEKISRIEAARRVRPDSGASTISMSPSAPVTPTMVNTPTSVVSPMSPLHAVTSRILPMSGRHHIVESDLDSVISTEISDKARPPSPLPSSEVGDASQTAVRTLVPAVRPSSTETKQSDGSGDTTLMAGNLPLSVPAPEAFPVLDAKVEERDSDASSQPPSAPSLGVSHTKSLRLVRRRHMSDFHMEPLMKKRKSDSEEPNQSAVLANGSSRQPRTESLRREELINCTCGYHEEDGLMIQCDLCMCWQHGLCNNIEQEDHVPEKYVCFICQHPPRERRSKHFLHDQDWLKEGSLPRLSFHSKNSVHRSQSENICKHSHDLAGSLLELQNVIHSLHVKVNIAEKTDHPKLYLWAHSWERTGYACQNQTSGDAFSRNKDVKTDADQEQKLNLKETRFLVEAPSRQPDITIPASYDSAACDTDCDAVDPSINLVGEHNNIGLGEESVDLLADECDTKDTCFSQDTVGSAKEVGDVRVEDKGDLVKKETKTSDISETVVLENNMDIGTETEVATASIHADQDQEEIVEKEDNKVNEVHVRKSDDRSEKFPGNSGLQLQSRSTTFLPDVTLPDKKLDSFKTEASNAEDELNDASFSRNELHDTSSLISKVTPLKSSGVTNGDLTRQLQPSVPQPEAPIDPAECQLTLLDHIEHLHQQIESRLTSLETQIEGLESTDSYLAHDEDADPRTKETVQMLLRDLSALYDIAAFN